MYIFSKREIRKKSAIDIFLAINKHPVPNRDVLVRKSLKSNKNVLDLHEALQSIWSLD